MSITCKVLLLQVAHIFLNSPITVSRLFMAIFAGAGPEFVLK